MDDRILELLGSGLSPVMTASVLGCSESRISQLLADEEFATRVTALRLTNMQKTIGRDNAWDIIEDALLKKLQDILPFIMDPLKILRALQVVNSAKRRGAPALENTGTLVPRTVVNITVPTSLAVQFLRNGNNEVVEISGRSLIPATQQQVLSKLKEQQAQQQQSVVQIEIGESNDGGRTVPQLPLQAARAEA